MDESLSTFYGIYCHIIMHFIIAILRHMETVSMTLNGRRKKTKMENGMTHFLKYVQ